MTSKIKEWRGLWSFVADAYEAGIIWVLNTYLVGNFL